MVGHRHFRSRLSRFPPLPTLEAFKHWFVSWLRFPIAISPVQYVLLALHMWAGIYFGLRWFR